MARITAIHCSCDLSIKQKDLTSSETFIENKKAFTLYFVLLSQILFASLYKNFDQMTGKSTNFII